MVEQALVDFVPREELEAHGMEKTMILDNHAWNPGLILASLLQDKGFNVGFSEGEEDDKVQVNMDSDAEIRMRVVKKHRMFFSLQRIFEKTACIADIDGMDFHPVN